MANFHFKIDPADLLRDAEAGISENLQRIIRETMRRQDESIWRQAMGGEEPRPPERELNARPKPAQKRVMVEVHRRPAPGSQQVFVLRADIFGRLEPVLDEAGRPADLMDSLPPLWSFKDPATMAAACNAVIDRATKAALWRLA